MVNLYSELYTKIKRKHLKVNMLEKKSADDSFIFFP